MCYESLVEGDATEQPLAALLWSELRHALNNGLAAAAVVAAVLASRGADPVVTAVSAAGAVVLGAVVHQAVLAVATVTLRAWAGVRPADRSVDVAGEA